MRDAGAASSRLDALTWQQILTELSLPHLQAPLSTTSLAACLDGDARDPNELDRRLCERGVDDALARRELVLGLARIAHLRATSLDRVPAPSCLDWMDADPREGLGRGDRFVAAVHLLLWRGNVRRRLAAACATGAGLDAAPAPPAFRIISNNCWGTAHTQALARRQGAPYATPFVGLFMHAPCYVRMLEALETYMCAPLRPATSSAYGPGGALPAYPVGRWLDAEVHFLHAASVTSAIETFERRRARFLASPLPLLVKMDDRDGFTDELGARFLALPLERRLLFVGQRNARLAGDGVVVLADDDATPDGRVLELGAGVEDVARLAEAGGAWQGVEMY